MSRFEPAEFGRYYLVDKIAVGGMAEVFKAKSYSERGFEKLLVIKRILDHLSDNDEFVEMFIDEAKISVELQHANIVQIYDFGKAGDNYYIAMECVEGKDAKSLLRKLARRRKLMPQEFAVYIAIEACRGLDYAHKRTNVEGSPLNIVHRDISPSNLIVSYTGEVKVADFGIAKAENAAFNTKDGVLKGKFEYMSPEQARGKSVNHLSDVFAVGIILHEMLTGRRLFKTDSDIVTLEKIKAVDIPRVKEVNPTVPATLDDIVMKALEQDPDARYADARAFQTALLEYIYPTTPDVIRDSLETFMGQLFADEIAAERTRLAEGSRIAEELHARPKPAPVQDWESTATNGTAVQPAPPNRLPLLLSGVAVVLLAALTISFALREPETRVVEVRAAPVAQPATLQLAVEPKDVVAEITVDGIAVSHAPGKVITVDMKPGTPQLLRVTAPDHTPYEETVTVAEGERFRVKVVLEPLVVEEVAPPPPPRSDTPADPTPTPSAVKATLALNSNPSGAQVTIDGAKVGSTPMSWPMARGGATHRVEYRLAGHETMKFKVSVPTDGGTVSAERNLSAKAAATPGTLTVSVRGGWGDVFINGKKVDQTPLSRKLPPGTYTVRVTNKDAGLDESRSVTIASGEVARLSL